MKVDLNCDIGESFGAWRMGDDAALMDIVSSVNIACGFHAGDPSVIRATVERAAAKGLRIGAHPSFPDLQGFGRREMKLSTNEVFDIVLYQVAALRGICHAVGGIFTHVKPHGALYNLAAKDAPTAAAIAGAVKKIDPTLTLVGLSGSLSILEAAKIGLETASEVFADRTYQADGSLTPRSRADAVIYETERAVAQVLKMVFEGKVVSTDGTDVPIAADTICLHGDGETAVELASNIRAALNEKGVVIG